MNNEGPLFHKPQSFLTARRLLYTSIFLGVITYAVQIGMIGFIGNSVLNITIWIVEILLNLFFIHQMSLCKNWARITWTVLFIIGMIAYPFSLIQLFKANLFLAALSVLNTALTVVALVFLFNKDTNEWFNSNPSRALP